MKLGFCTDIHLDHLPKTDNHESIRVVGRKLAEGHDALVVSGDISVASKFREHFQAFCEGAVIPVYFVGGNHDMWGDRTEDEVRETMAEFPGFLDTGLIVSLTSSTVLIGRTGWYDTLSGNPYEGSIMTNDLRFVERLKGCWSVPNLVTRVCQDWAKEETEKAVETIENALRTDATNIYFATHFPCFTQACFDENGNIDVEENGWWPWSINTTLGHELSRIAFENPHVNFTVLTGHTHGAGQVKIRDNLTCISGDSEYEFPRIARTFKV